MLTLQVGFSYYTAPAPNEILHVELLLVYAQLNASLGLHPQCLWRYNAIGW